MGSVSHDSNSCITLGATPRGPLQRPAQQLDASPNVVISSMVFFSILFGKWSERVGNGGRVSRTRLEWIRDGVVSA